MNVEILKGCPISGQYDEYFIDSDKESVVCVKFEDEEYMEYCCSFGGGIGSKSAAIFGNEFAFIISYGQGYIFSINERKLIYRTDCDYLQSVRFTNYNHYFLAENGIELFVYDRDFLWSSGRVSSDGIIIERFEDNIVYGRVFNFIEWVSFSLDLKSFKFNCDWDCEIP